MYENGSEIADTVDPRVHVELERLNNATDEINRLEVDLDEARASFRNLLCDSTAKVDQLRLKLGICIERAKPYYEARFCANEALKETQVAAMKYERANSAHSAAREMVYLAEQGLGGRTLGKPVCSVNIYQNFLYWLYRQVFNTAKNTNLSNFPNPRLQMQIMFLKHIGYKVHFLCEHFVTIPLAHGCCDVAFTVYNRMLF